MSKTVIGLFNNLGEAQNVVKDLVARGIERDDIGFMANEKQVTPGRTDMEREGGDVASGALAGAGTGAAIGGVAGLALALAPLAIPGIGPIIAAGPIAAALTGAGLGAVAGGLDWRPDAPWRTRRGCALLRRRRTPRRNPGHRRRG